jgi:hypothetical protein
MHRVQVSQDIYGQPDSPPLAADDDNVGESPAAGDSHSSPESPTPPTPRSPDIPPDNTTLPEGYDFWTWRAILHWPRPHRDVCFADYSKRLTSFSGHWPTDGSAPEAAKLAEAVFYFDGELHSKGDCFFLFFHSLRYLQTQHKFFTFQFGRT